MPEKNKKEVTIYINCINDYYKYLKILDFNY